MATHSLRTLPSLQTDPPPEYHEAVISVTAARPAHADDLDGLLRLEEESFTGYYEPHRYERWQFSYYLGNPKSIVLVANHGDHLAGYVLGIVSRRGELPGACLHSIAVENTSRRRGIGEALLEGFLEEAGRRDCKFASLEVAPENAAAVPLFEKFGFSETRALPDYYGKDHSGVRMYKPL